MNQEKVLGLILSEPYPEKLWQLRGDLLEKGIALEHSPLWVLNRFHQFINELEASAKTWNDCNFASILDLAPGVRGVLQNLEDRGGSDDGLKGLLLGAVSEGFIVAADRL